MSEIDINIDKATAELSILSDNIEVELYTYNKNNEVRPEDICIEISGLTTLESFIGLSDTPLYYEDGKFFKVVGNKIEYTDIKFEDIKGDIPEDSELFKIISDFVDERITELSGTVIDDKIEQHNISSNSHQDIRDYIQNSYDDLGAKIELSKLELNQQISTNTENISDLEEATNNIRQEVDNLVLSVDVDLKQQVNLNSNQISKNTSDIYNNYIEFKNQSKIVDDKINNITQDVQNFSPIWYSIEDLLQ